MQWERIRRANKRAESGVRGHPRSRPMMGEAGGDVEVDVGVEELMEVARGLGWGV